MVNVNDEANLSTDMESVDDQMDKLGITEKNEDSLGQRVSGIVVRWGVTLVDKLCLRNMFHSIFLVS